MKGHPGSSRRGGSAAAVAGILVTLALAVGIGCRDDIAAPTQGFIDVFTDGVGDVQVFVDDELVGTGVERVGPVDSGTYRVRVEKEYYLVEPVEGVDVTVVPAEAVSAAFDLELNAPGSATLTAVDEFTGEDIAGAAIWMVGAGGQLENTQRVTPATIENLPPGPVEFAFRKDGYAENPTFTVQIPVLENVAASDVLGPAPAVLAEMFTFVTCANCEYPAEELHDQFLARNGRLFVVEWHIVSVQWMYNLNAPLRQTFYQTLGSDVFSAPTTVFQGTLPWREGGDDSDFIPYYTDRIDVELSVCEGDCPVAITASGTITPAGDDDAAATVVTKLKWRGGSLPGELRLRSVLLGNDIHAGGKVFHFAAHDVDVQVVSFSAPGEILEFSADLDAVTEIVAPPRDWTVGEWSWVVYLQSDSTGEVLAVTGQQ